MHRVFFSIAFAVADADAWRSLHLSLDLLAPRPRRVVWLCWLVAGEEQARRGLAAGVHVRVPVMLGLGGMDSSWLVAKARRRRDHVAGESA